MRYITQTEKRRRCVRTLVHFTISPVLVVFSHNTIGADAVRAPRRPFLFIFFRSLSAESVCVWLSFPLHQSQWTNLINSQLHSRISALAQCATEDDAARNFNPSAAWSEAEFNLQHSDALRTNFYVINSDRMRFELWTERGISFGWILLLLLFIL